MSAYEPFVYYGPQPFEWHVERVPASRLNVKVDEWKRLQRDGWDVTVLLAEDASHAVAVGCRGDA